MTQCVDFDLCINKNGYLSDDGDADCDPSVGSSSCTDCTSCAQGENEHGAGIKLSCTDPDAFPANNGGTNGYIYCECDGKNNCEWKSDDFKGDLTEDDICITDSNCPVR